jgi:hypothetical protein
MSATVQNLTDFRRWRQDALILGLVGLALLAAGWFVSSEQFFRSYLWAFLFWLSIALGCLPLLMLYHLVGGSWGFTIRRIIESGTRTLPLMAILFLPIILGVHSLYEWSRPDAVAQSAILRQKQIYLNTPFWALRAIVYFAVWLFYTQRLHRLSMEQDETADVGLVRRFQRLSGPGLIVYAFTLTFAVFDWAMSLEPEWFSTIYGMFWMVSQALAALSFSVIVVGLLSHRGARPSASAAGTLHDLGNLLLAFVMLWAYLSFSQLLIIWSGNLPEEISWYLSRLRHGWQWVAVVILAFHFITPFLLLLSRFMKRRARSLVAIACLILAMRMVDTFWIITPAFYKNGFAIHWMDLFALVGIGGVWLAVFAGKLASVPLAPIHDPNLAPHKAI